MRFLVLLALLGAVGGGFDRGWPESAPGAAVPFEEGRDYFPDTAAFTHANH